VKLKHHEFAEFQYGEPTVDGEIAKYRAWFQWCFVIGVVWYAKIFP